MESPISIKEKTVGSSIIEESLLSMEELDRTSPELWPEQRDEPVRLRNPSARTLPQSCIRLAWDKLLPMQANQESPSRAGFPLSVPGESEYYASATSFGKGQTWMKGLDNDDKAFLIYLSKLTPTGLVSEVKKLYDTAYQLGCEESKEMTRGKYLKVLIKKSNSGSV